MNQSFNDVYKRLNNRVHSFVRSRISDPHSADDLVQDIFLKVHDQINEVRDMQKLDAWIFRIARNRVIDYYRSRKPQPGLKTDSLLQSMPEKEEILHEFTEDIHQMIHRLPTVYREVIELTELQGLKYAEVAERLGLSVPAVKSRVLRGREKLREMLLECCHFEFTRRGEVVDFTPRKQCRKCITHGIHEN